MSRSSVAWIALALVLAGCAAPERVDTPEPRTVEAPPEPTAPPPPAIDVGLRSPGGMLQSLTQPLGFEAHRESSWDRSGRNGDARGIPPGETLTLCELEGPGVISHIWCTVAAEEFYSRKIILRAYWDGASEPSIEAPLGDFFCVGHGIDRPVQSLPVRVSSEGRARNCFWQMPFQKSARLEVENQGAESVRAFYYYIDYRRVPDLPEDSLYFHARYRQEWPCPAVDLKGVNLDGAHNYTLLETEGRGHYLGCNLSITNSKPGWWGEGDDFIWVDGEFEPSFNGTGSEDYFCDAWGMREIDGLFYGCPLCEGFDTGDHCTVYRFHVPDPIPFKKSIKVSIEHGHANDRSDNFSSVAYWYQDKPFKNTKDVFSIPPVTERLPEEALGMMTVATTTNEVLKLLQNGDADTASQRMAATLRQHPDAANAGPLMLLSAMRLEDKNQAVAAKATYERIVENWPKTTAGRLAKAAAWRLGGDNRAAITLTCDDVFTLYLDGVELGTAQNWINLKTYQSLLLPGKHVLAVKCRNIIGLSGLVLSLRSGDLTVNTDSTWRASREAAEGWNRPEFDAGAWESARVYGRGTSTPSGVVEQGLVGIPPIAEWIWADDNDKAEETVYLRKTFEVTP